MWRSLFYAVGIGLFLLGGQGLVLDSVVVQKNGKVQKLVSKILSDDAAPNRPGNPTPAASPVRQLANAPVNNGWNVQPSFPNNAGSRFGPSRFSGPAYGDYGGGRLGSFGAPVSRPGNVANAQLAGFQDTTATVPPIDKTRFSNFVIKEWMPWSLLALGAIIFLYTHSTSRNHSD